MAKHEAYYIGKRSITSGNKTHKPGKVVTAKIMGLSDDEFAEIVKRGGIKKGKPPEEKKPGAPEAPVLRADRINRAIGELFKPDGSAKSKDDFTQDGKPTCDALNILALLDGEEEVTAPERDAAWEKYQAEKAQQ